nr:DMT family transporter [Stenoxybacter acetivorans]
MSKAGLQYLDSVQLFFFQILSAAVLVWLVLLIQRKKLLLNKGALKAYATGILEPFLAYVLTLYGLEYVSSGIASIIFSLESIFTLLFSVIFLKMKINTIGIFILLLFGTMIGSLMAVLLDIGLGSNKIYGYFFILAGVLFAAVYVLISSKLVESFDPIVLLTGQLTFCLLLTVILLFFTGNNIAFPGKGKVLIFLSGVFQYFLAFILYLYSLKWIKVYIAGVMLYFIPITALILSYLFLEENISSMQITGIGMVIICVFLLNKKYEYK